MQWNRDTRLLTELAAAQFAAGQLGTHAYTDDIRLATDVRQLIAQSAKSEEWESSVLDLAIQLLREVHGKVDSLKRTGRVGGEMVTWTLTNRSLQRTMAARTQIDGTDAEIQSSIDDWRKSATENLSSTKVAYDADKISVGELADAMLSSFRAEMTHARHLKNRAGVLAASRDLIGIRLVAWNRVNALYKAGRVGGEAEKKATARLLFETARIQFLNAGGTKNDIPHYAVDGDRLELPETKGQASVRVASDKLMTIVLAIDDAGKSGIEPVVVAMNHVVEANLIASQIDRALQPEIIQYLYELIGKCEEINNVAGTEEGPQKQQLVTGLRIALATLNVMAADSESR